MKNMASKKIYEESEVARQCRLALENNWGTTIPVPKIFEKKSN
jgi:hypothetical protein